MSSPSELAKSVIESIGSPERKQKNETSHGANPPSMITKIERWALPSVLEALFTVIPDYDDKNHLMIGAWDSGLAWVILKELSQEQANQLRHQLEPSLEALDASYHYIDAILSGLIHYRDL